VLEGIGKDIIKITRSLSKEKNYKSSRSPSSKLNYKIKTEISNKKIIKEHLENKFDQNTKLDKTNKNINDFYNEKEKGIIEDKLKKKNLKESFKEDYTKETSKKSKK